MANLWKDLEAWWEKIRTDSQPEFAQLRATLEAEIHLIKADVTEAAATAHNDIVEEIQKYSPEVQKLATDLITRIKDAVLAAVEKH